MIQEATALSVLTSGRVWVRMSGRADPVLTNAPAVRVEPGDPVLVADISAGRGNYAIVGLRSPVLGSLTLGAGWAFEAGVPVAVSRTGDTIRTSGVLVPNGTPGVLIGTLPWGPRYPVRLSLPVDVTGSVGSRSVEVRTNGEVRFRTTAVAELLRLYVDLVLPA